MSDLETIRRKLANITNAVLESATKDMQKEHTLFPNEFLRQVIKAYYSLDYVGFGNPNNPDYINTLKNDFEKNSKQEIELATISLCKTCKKPIRDIINNHNIDMVCIVPRAKKLSFYSETQLFFKSSIEKIVNSINSNLNGLHFIQRHKNTRTTHFHKKPEYGGDGDMPYPGITKDTCYISPKVSGKNILLIDDIYTKTINIDEDCIQALLDNGANSVVLYTVARTARKYEFGETAL